MSFSLLGRPEMEAAFARLVDVVSGDHAVAALQAGAQPLINSWKSKAPVRTGSYRRSIHLLDQVDHTADQVTVYVGTDIVDPPYPFFLEFGTRHMAPRPSARPAFDDSRDEVVREVGAALKTLVDRGV